MDIFIYIVIIIGFSVWTIRPLYNFFAKNKYVLLDQNKYTLKNQIRAGLPAVVFYLVLFLFVMIPARMENIVQSGTTFSIIILEVILIYVLSRIDKFQTKYQVDKHGVTFRNKFIYWNDRYSVNYKKTWLFVLHKPRFILTSNTTKITVPLLSKNINKFVEELYRQDPMNGDLVSEIIHNARLYYITNPELQKKLNKTI